MMATDEAPTDCKKRPASLKVRIFWVSLAWIAVALTATGVVLNQLFEHHVRQQYQKQLQVYADYVLTSIEFPDQGVPQLDQTPQNPRFLTPLSGLYWQLNNGQGNAVLRSRSLWDEQLQAPSDALTAGQAHFHIVLGPQAKEVLLLEQTVRFESRPDQQWRLLVAEDAQSLMSSIHEWQQTLVVFLSVLFLCLGLAALAQVVVGLSPLRRLQANIARLKSGDSARLDGSYPSEFSALVDGFNGVLDANERVVQRARAQAGDLAHAIKTPLTVMSTALDQTQAGQHTCEDLVRVLREQISTMGSQVDWKLRHARLVAQTSEIRQRVCSVEPVVQQMVRVMRKLYASRGIQFEVELEREGLHFFGETQDLVEMLGNLLDNAGKWAQSRVLLRIGITVEHLFFEVEDDGPGIAAEKRSEALKRGVRMDERTPGSGLGLAIVDDLAQLYQGCLELESAKLGGLLVRLKLPGRCDQDAYGQ